jgi:hypothetical protein
MCRPRRSTRRQPFKARAIIERVESPSIDNPLAPRADVTRGSRLATMSSK